LGTVVQKEERIGYYEEEEGEEEEKNELDEVH